jgi:hypothetical protein
MTERITLGGLTNTTIHLESDGSFTIEEKQDCQDILDRNQRGRDHRFDARSKDGFYEEVAEIPMIPYLDACRKANQQPFAVPDLVMETMLRDPQYAKFLSAPKSRDPHIRMRGIR